MCGISARDDLSWPELDVQTLSENELGVILELNGGVSAHSSGLLTVNGLLMRMHSILACKICLP